MVNQFHHCFNRHKNCQVHKQTAYGYRTSSNPFMVDNLPKIVGFSNSPCLSWLRVGSPGSISSGIKGLFKFVDSDSLLKIYGIKCTIIGFPEKRLLTGKKGILNPLMAGSLPKTIKPTELDVAVLLKRQVAKVLTKCLDTFEDQDQDLTKCLLEDIPSQRNNPPQYPRIIYLPILNINYFHHFLDILRNYDPMDDEPMWAADHVVAPTHGSAITIPETANEFAIKGNHLTLVKGNQFDGRTKTDPHKHIHEFLRICDMFKYRDTENEAVRLMMFPLSLTGEAKTWLDELNEGTIETWDELRTAFISRFFPPSSLRPTP
ncbi:reverse transcriptase domain-containing protein [Tanacetum coccineum]